MSGTEYLLDNHVVIGLLKGYGPAIALAATAITGRLRLLTLDQGMIQGLQRLGYDF